MSIPPVLAESLADRYRLERELGSGGMATVYLARDLKHDREVAIKVLHPDLGAALGGERFLAEIRTTAKLQHPHILPLLDSGDTGNGLLYYVMPFVRGETLRARLERERQLPVSDAVRIAREVADALQHAHGQGIVHRDIKPENILLQDGHALVADFGIALAVQQAGGPRMTQTGLSLGTPHYMSPEQAMGERTIDARSDIYALGAVTYEMLCGDPPFPGSSIQAIVARVLTERPASIRSVRGTVPPHVEAVVFTALEKMPADRFGSAREFADALQNTGFSGERSPVVDATHSSRPRAMRWIGRVVAAITFATAGYAAAHWRDDAATMRGPSPVLRFPVSVDSPYRVSNQGVAILADGSGFAFVGDGPPGHGIYVRRFSDTSYTHLPLPDASVGLTTSPDGQSLLVYVFTQTQSRVMIVPLNGNPPRPWTDSLRFGLAMDEQGWLWGSHHAIDGLARVSPDGRQIDLLTRPDPASGEASHRWPVLLPDARGAFFSIDYADGRPPSMAVFDAATKKVKRLGPGRPSALVDGKYLLFATVDSTLSAQRFDVDRLELQGPLVPLERGAHTTWPAFQVQVSRSGDAMYLINRAGTWSIAGTEDGRPAALLGGSGDPPTGFRMAPNGRTAAIAVADGLAFQSTDGSVRRISLGVPVKLSTFLPDGSGIVLMRQGSSGAGHPPVRAEVASLDAASLPRPLDNGPNPLPAATHARFIDGFVAATKGGAVMFNGSGPDSIRGIAFFPRGGGSPVLISASGFGPEPSPDGRYVAWERAATETMWDRTIMVSALPPATGTWEIGRGLSPRWSLDSRTLYFQEPMPRPYDFSARPILKVRIEPGPGFQFGAPTLAARPPANASGAWDVGPTDGTVYWMTSTSRRDVVYTHNFKRLVDSVFVQAGASRK